MDDPNALDVGVLARYLEAEVAGFSGLESIEKFASGQSNPTYLLRRKNRTLRIAGETARAIAEIRASGGP